ncbi:MAG: leucyl-tRNA synthetase, eubacterial and mitochondrial family, partial [Microgenomates group bacterium Gr01-1014_93]
CPKCGGPGKRETNTMPQWAGSCWYYLRFCDPENKEKLVSGEADKYWMPVDWYVGGAEHAVLHLLYSRFWHKFLFDIGVVGTKEPFQKLTNVGLVLAADGRKMSKRWGNVVLAEDIVKEYGADTLRVYECFMGPFENIISWDPKSINGVYRFLQRVWLLSDKISGSKGEAFRAEDLKIMHKTIKQVTEDIENIKLNTAIAALMEWLNYLSSKAGVEMEEYKTFLLLLAPFAPHITEELWSDFAEASSDKINWSIHQQSWPEFDNKFLEENEITVVVQVNGKVRETLLIQKDMISDKKVVENLALNSEKVKKFIGNKPVKKSVYIEGRVLNLVV